MKNISIIFSIVISLMIMVQGCDKPYVKLTDENAFYGDLDDNLKIETSDATYYFRKSGGGFSGIIDSEGNDWINHSKAYLFRPDIGGRHFLGEPTEETDIKSKPLESWEWCYFGDTKTKRAFYFIHHEDDLLPDYYRPLGEMTVFGFGRTGNANENIIVVPQNFTIGFYPDTAYQVISDKIRNIVEE